MVNLGRSNGCNTCKARKVKCDQGRPRCQRCQGAGRQCAGYEKLAPKLRFVNVVCDAGMRHSQVSAPSSIVPLSIVPPPALHREDVAWPFFLTNFVSMGRNVTSSHGFFEMLPRVLSGERHDSALSLAVSAVSTAMLDRWLRLGDGFGASSQSFKKAISRLQVAVGDPAESFKTSTVLAALTLQFHDNVSAMLGLSEISRTHHEGSVALLRHQRRDPGNRHRRGSPLASYILHTEVTFATRDGRNLPASELSWLDWDATALNPSSQLDMVGIEIANLQNEFANVLHSSSLAKNELDQLLSKALAVDMRLRTWARGIPASWHPVEFDHTPLCIPPVATYAGVFDIYPSVQIASLWNTWQCYRLITLKVKLRCLELRTDNLQALADDTSIRETVQDIVGCFCRSIPFFLGNRTEPGSLHDFTDPRIFLPSHHYLDNQNEHSFQQGSSSVDLMTREEHFRHVISQGPWHCLLPLSRLLGIFSPTHCSSFAQLLELETREWIREQLVRTQTLMGTYIRGGAAEKTSSSSCST